MEELTHDEIIRLRELLKRLRDEEDEALRRKLLGWRYNLRKVAMKYLAFVALLLLPSIAHAQGWLNGLGAFSNGYSRGQFEAQELESLRLQNEMVRIQRQMLLQQMMRDNQPHFAPPRLGYIPN